MGKGRDLGLIEVVIGACIRVLKCWSHHSPLSPYCLCYILAEQSHLEIAGARSKWILRNKNPDLWVIAFWINAEAIGVIKHMYKATAQRSTLGATQCPVILFANHTSSQHTIHHREAPIEQYCSLAVRTGSMAPQDPMLPSTWLESINPSLWRDAIGIVQNSMDLNAIEYVCKFLLDPEDAMNMLHKPRKSFLLDLCQRKSIPLDGFNHPASWAREFVKTVRGPQLTGQEWDVNWIVQAILSASTRSRIKQIADKFDTSIHSALCKVPFSDLVSFSLRQNSTISGAFAMMSSLSNELARHFKPDDRRADLLQNELQHPLSRWVVSNARSSVPFSDPKASDTLQFLLGPIIKVFEDRLSVSKISERLQILEGCFKSRTMYRRTLDDSPLSTDFTLWDSIRAGRSDHLTRSYTTCVISLLSTLSVRDILQHLPGIQQISKNWLDLADDVFICLNMDGELADGFMELAKGRRLCI
ncbi:hypothetical protein BKA65DRAFT_483576 [Rhexocercosporidium sp. MPI-PUGE-AT-0058]|nr:hypothetical protein BKA65DRAFT_483576 [Rhexocercosporidium sp. MPI-PUGE-AT-0058]